MSTPRRLSLRTRLLWAFLVPLVVVLAVVGAGATAALRSELIGQVDARLAAAVDRSTRADEAPGGDVGDGVGPDFLLAPGQGDGTLGARVADGVVTEAAVIGARGQREELTARQADSLAGVVADGAPRTVDLGALGAYRLVATPAGDGEVIVTGLPLASVRTALLRVVAVEVAAGLLGLLAAGGAAALVIGRTLRPLQRVAVTADRVAEVPLSSGEVRLAERVPAAETDRHTEVGRVGAALNRLLDHVETSMAARQASETRLRQFVADASHELRTPVTSIRGYTELVRRRGGLPDDADSSLRRVEAEALRMSGLVDDLLLLARLDAGRELVPGTVDLTALVMDVVSDAHAAGPSHRWRVDLPSAAVLVPGDGARLHQVLANLLANVRTHTPGGTTATTRLRVDDGRAVVEVADDGPGIPADLLGEVFERFARADSSRSRRNGSTGLGLAIVQAVVSGHDGTVGVASAPGRTVVTVRLPGATVAEPDAEPEPDDTGSGNRAATPARAGGP
ncbi:sensor histidine kinase [Geodermatophilus sp. CPCC 205761]|uniref:sensor histidine kinase n=1 Tax=Geodermatophilus sp. CPCC 205761 TaxID=2936597 RepID=UPI003EE9432A